MSHEDTGRPGAPQDTSAPPSNTSRDKSVPLPPADEKTGHDIRRILLMFVSVIWTGIIFSIASEKWGQGVPLWAFILLCVIGLLPLLYLGWTAEPIKKRRHLIHSYPMLSFFVITGVCAVIGGGIGALLWWSVYSQPAVAAPNAPATQPAQKDAVGSKIDELLQNQQRAEQKVDQLLKDQGATPEKLLAKYPMGYVIYELTYENKVFPYANRTLDKYEVDWSVARLTEVTADSVKFRLPDMKSPKGYAIGNITLGGPKRVGEIEGFAINREIKIGAEILAVKDTGIVFLIGFRAPKSASAPLSEEAQKALQEKLEEIQSQNAQSQQQVAASLQDINKQLVELKSVPNTNLKKHLLELSRQIFVFIGEKEKHEPRPPNYDRSKSKEQRWAETETWHKRYEGYIRETMAEYERRFGPEVIAAVSEAKAKGIDTSRLGPTDSLFYGTFDSDVRNPVNPIGVSHIAKGLALLAGKL